VTSDPTLASFFRSFSRSGGLVVGGLGALGLVGWILDAAMLKSVVPGLAPIKANAALGLTPEGLARKVREVLEQPRQVDS